MHCRTICYSVFKRNRRVLRVCFLPLLLITIVSLSSTHVRQCVQARIFLSLREVGLSHTGPYNRLVVFGNRYENDSGADQQLVSNYYYKTLKFPGVVLKVKGGIGNQLFQYACSYALSQDLMVPLYLYHEPASYSEHRGFKSQQREFALDQFKISLENVFDKTSITPNVIYQNDREFLQRNFFHTNGINISNHLISLDSEHYCQSKEYWWNYQEDIADMFRVQEWAINSTKLLPIIELINGTIESVAVHVRRGDFMKDDIYFVPISYQRLAIRKITKTLQNQGKAQPIFFVFSDDKEYAQRKLADLKKMYKIIFFSDFSTDTTSIEDFYLMTLCKHIIFPNSTFSWWAAYLNKNPGKIVIASAFNPKFIPTNSEFKWMPHGHLYHPKEWIVIDPFTGGLALKPTAM